MSTQTPQVPQTSGKKPAYDPAKSRTVFLRLVLLAAIAGAFLIVSALFNPHKTGIVTSVGRITTYKASTGVGKHRSEFTKYASDVKVRVKDTSDTERVYYRVRDLESIPQVGDEIKFAHSFAVGNVPYPQMLAVWTGVFLMGLAGVLFGGYKIDEFRKNKRKPTSADTPE